MDVQLLGFRIVHVGFGVFWVGADLFLSFLLFPRLRALGHEVERKVMGSLMRALPPVMMGSSLLTTVSGIWMMGVLKGWNFRWALADAWGVAMLVGLIGTLATLVVGFGIVPPLTIRYNRLSQTFEGREPSPEEAHRLQRAGAQVTNLVHVNSVLLIVVVIAMAVARFL